MVIVYEHELINCGSLPDFEKNLREKMSLDSAEIWISGNGTSDDLPCIAILINDTKAVVNIFCEDGSNYVSSGDEDAEGYVTFCDGQYEIAACQMVDKEDAVQAAMDFYTTKDRSNKINWEILSK